MYRVFSYREKASRAFLILSSQEGSSRRAGLTRSGKTNSVVQNPFRKQTGYAYIGHQMTGSPVVRIWWEFGFVTPVMSILFLDIQVTSISPFPSPGLSFFPHQTRGSIWLDDG